MFRFRLGSIPVEVHPSHLLVSGMLALGGIPERGTSTRWPFGAVGAETASGHASAVAVYILSWMFIVFVSVLIHELGHALASRMFGYRPSIALAWMGGHTLPTDAPGPLPWKRDVLITAAGPFFGLMLGFASYAASQRFEEPPGLVFFLQTFALANFFWAVLNMMPVLPLDGGRITTALATRAFGPRTGFMLAQGLAVLASVGIVLLGVALQQFILVVMFAMFGLQAFRAMLASFQGGAAESAPLTGPLAEKLREARVALDAGRMDEARRLGASVLEAPEGLTPTLASHAHHLMGWIALKEGHGRKALDHFSQVQGLPVEPHAVAASFSLVGDDARAVEWWKQAWQTSSDRTVMHEYAGTLIRMGREAEAMKLPSVDPEAAFSCAERVLFIRGAYSEAAAVGEAALKHAPSATLAYDAACAYARARNVPDAMRLLHRATELGFTDGTYAASDEDLAPLHGYPAFEAWLTELRQSAAS